MFTSDKTIKWVENLADQECLILSGEKSSLDLCNAKEEVMNNETSFFVRSLFYYFEYLTRLFNARVDDTFLRLKIVAQGENFNTFTISRNRINLRVVGAQPGAIHLQCIREDSGEMGINSVVFSGLIEARFETFHEVKWYFLDSMILPEQVARHYLTEFLQVSRSNHTH